MPPTLYWYDFETTGIDSIVDRPIQFAGVRTNLDLEEVGEAQNFLGRPGDDCLPEPEAMLVTGIHMSELLKTGLPERDFAAAVLREFTQAETCVVGFNSIRFDDEFTRQMLYRNFHDPYAREWQSGNSRWDVIDLFRAAQALRPDGFNWPLKPDGVPGFRLEELARANGLPHLDAHDALADVRATIEVVRCLKSAQPRLFDYGFSLRDKRFVVQQLYPLGKSPVVHVSSMFPAARHCTALVLPLCQHPTNSNAIICFDLSQSPSSLIDASIEELSRLLFSTRAALGDGEERIALKTIYINRSPFVAPLTTLDEAAITRLNVDVERSLRRSSRLMNTPGLVEKIQDVFAARDFPLVDDPDFQLYQGGFFSDSDRSAMQALHQSPADQLAGFSERFVDDRLEEMLFRFRARNHPDGLNEAERQRWNRYRRERFETGDRLQLLKRRTQEMRTKADSEAAAVLDDLMQYYERIEKSSG